MREIAIAGEGGRGRVGAPLQAEALAYFARMTTPPSATYRDAVNWAVWRWKAIGAWTLIKGLWILAADTSQAGLLSVIGDTPRDAVIVGTSPTFTALKGFSGFTFGKQIKFPITAAILASDNVFSFAALKALQQIDNSDPENPTPAFGAMIQSDAGSTFANPGHYLYGASGTPGNMREGIIVPGQGNPLVKSTLVGGAKGAEVITAGGSGSVGGTGTAARSSNYITTGWSLTALNRLCAYGFLDAAATTAQCRQFTAILAAMLDMLGALD